MGCKVHLGCSPRRQNWSREAARRSGNQRPLSPGLIPLKKIFESLQKLIDETMFTSSTNSTMKSSDYCPPSSAATSPTSPVLPSPLYWAAGILSDKTIATKAVTATTTGGDHDEHGHKKKPACLPTTTLEIIAAGSSGLHWFTKGHSPLYILEHPRRRVLGQGLFSLFCTGRGEAAYSYRFCGKQDARKCQTCSCLQRQLQISVFVCRS